MSGPPAISTSPAHPIPASSASTLEIKELFDCTPDVISQRVETYINKDLAVLGKLLYEVSTYPDKGLEEKRAVLNALNDLWMLSPCMQELLSTSPYQFIYVFTLLNQNCKQRAISVTLTTLPMAKLVECAAAVQDTQWTIGQKQAVMDNLYATFTPEQLKSFTDAHVATLASDPTTLSKHFLLVSNSLVAKHYSDAVFTHVKVNHNSLLLTFVEKTSQLPERVYPYVIKALISQTWMSATVLNVFKQLNIPGKTQLLLCADAATRVKLLSKIKPQEVTQSYINLIEYPKADSLCKEIARNYIMAIITTGFFFSFLSRLPKRPCKKNTHLFSAICDLKLETFVFTFLQNSDRQALSRYTAIKMEFLRSVLPESREDVIHLLKEIHPDHIRAVFENLWLAIDTEHIQGSEDTPPTLSSIITNLQIANLDEEASYLMLPNQAALRQVPPILIALAFFSEETREQIYACFEHLSDEQMCAVAKTVTADLAPSFVERTGQYFDVYFSDLPKCYLEEYARQKERELNRNNATLQIKHQGFLKLYKLQKGFFNQVNKRKVPDWDRYRKTFNTLISSRNEWIQLWQLTLSLAGRLERVDRKKTQQIQSIRQNLLTLRNAIAEPTSTEYLDLQAIKPPDLEVEDDEDDDDIPTMIGSIPAIELKSLDLASYADFREVGLQTNQDFEAIGLSKEYIEQVDRLLNSLSKFLTFNPNEKNKIIDAFFAYFSLGKCNKPVEQLEFILSHLSVGEKDFPSTAALNPQTPPSTKKELLKLIKENHYLTILQRYTTQAEFRETWVQLKKKGVCTLSELNKRLDNQPSNLFSLKDYPDKIKKKED